MLSMASGVKSRYRTTFLKLNARFGSPQRLRQAYNHDLCRAVHPGTLRLRLHSFSPQTLAENHAELLNAARANASDARPRW